MSPARGTATTVPCGAVSTIASTGEVSTPMSALDGSQEGNFFKSLERKLDMLVTGNKRHCLICKDPSDSNFLMLCLQDIQNSYV